MRIIRTPLLHAAILMVIAATMCQANTWKLMDTDSLVAYSDVIVSGRIVDSDDPPEAHRQAGKLGIIEVADVVYGPTHLKRIRIMLESQRHGNSYRVGDEGTWFLRKRPDGGAQATEMHAPERPPGEVAGFADAVFIAEHPATLWARNDDFFVRMKRPRLTDEHQKRRLLQLLDAVQTRLERDVRRLSESLTEAERNLAEVKRRREAQAPRQ